MRKGKPIYLGNGATPCYDPKTDTHCPNRKVGCAGSCSAWAEYVKKRDAGYKKKLEENDIKSTYIRTRREFNKRNELHRQRKMNTWRKNHLY